LEGAALPDTGPILVPLDGSDLAEGAVPYAAAFARALRERVVLFTAWEGTESELGAEFPAMALDVQQQATAHFTSYLEGIKQRIGGGVDVDFMIRDGEAGQRVLAAAEEMGARMLVIATHGRSGIGRWLYGSTAHHLLRHTTTPIVAVGPQVLKAAPGDVAIKHIMVALDGSSTSEQALAHATTLARAFGARISLVRGVRWAVQAYPYSLPDTYLPQVDQELEAGAKAYLQRVEKSVTGVDVSAFVVRGAVAEGLIEFVEREAVDLIVMTTHARSGLARAALGSVADRMLQAPAPVMLIRPEAAPS
jgi:nucleotide-binding universal stress UspA family protein